MLLRRKFLAFLGCLPFFKLSPASSKEQVKEYVEKKLGTPTTMLTYVSGGRGNGNTHHLVLTAEPKLTWDNVSSAKVFIDIENINQLTLLDDIAAFLKVHKANYISVQKADSPWNKKAEWFDTEQVETFQFLLSENDKEYTYLVFKDNKVSLHKTLKNSKSFYSITYPTCL
jgi:hypothetical protein